MTPDDELPVKKQYGAGFVFTIAWLIAWPVVGLIAAIILYNLVILNVAGDDTTEWDGSTVRGILFAMTSILAVMFLGFAKAMGRKSDIGHRTGRKVLLGYVAVGIFIGGVGMVYTDIPAKSETQAVAYDRPVLKQDAGLMKILRLVGAKYTDKLEVTYVKAYKNGDREGEHQSFFYEDGTFSHGVMTIKKGLNAEDKKTVVAHEYLHHIWDLKLDDTARNNLTSHLITLYGNDSVMRERVKDYGDKGTLLPTELFSYYCTESSDAYLTNYVKKMCNTYIKRSSLAMLR